MIIHINLAKGFRGGERQTLLLISEIAKKYQQIIVIRRSNTVFFDKLKDLANFVRIIRISKPYVLHLHQLKNARILHAHETKAAQLAFFANMVYKIPYMITRRVDYRLKNNFFNQKMYANSHYNVAISQTSANTINQINPNTNLEIISDAFSYLAKSTPNKLKNKYKDKFIIGHIGALVDIHKGQSYLINAFKKCQYKIPNAHLLLIGQGIDESKFKLQAQDYDNIEFTGFVNNVDDYIDIFDLFIFPSLTEGLGSILLDVMQAKVPIIASEVGGIPEIIENNKNGILIPIKNVDAMVESIELLYTNKILRNKLISNAYQKSSQFSAQNMVKSYQTLYQKMLHLVQ